MELWYFLVRFFRRKSRAAERRYELNYRMELADLRRKAEHLKRDAQQCREEAHQLQVSGEHISAVSKASMAMNHEKGYQTYLRMIRQCETMYAQSKTQKALMDLMKGCQDVSTAVIKQVDTEGVIKAQERLQQTSIQMDQLQESMRIFQEGFEPDADPSVREIAGEEALAAIMAEYEQKPAAPAGVREEIIEDAPETDTAELVSDEWAQQKRLELQELV